MLFETTPMKTQCFTFEIASGVFFLITYAGPLPTDMDSTGGDVAVPYWVDMFLLNRLIAERVNGDSTGKI